MYHKNKNIKMVDIDKQIFCDRKDEDVLGLYTSFFKFLLTYRGYWELTWIEQGILLYPTLLFKCRTRKHNYFVNYYINTYGGYTRIDHLEKTKKYRWIFVTNTRCKYKLDAKKYDSRKLDKIVGSKFIDFVLNKISLVDFCRYHIQNNFTKYEDKIKYMNRDIKKLFR